MDELMSKVFSLTHMADKIKIYGHQLRADTGYHLQDLLKAMDTRNGWGRRFKDINSSERLNTAANSI